MDHHPCVTESKGRTVAIERVLLATYFSSQQGLRAAAYGAVTLGEKGLIV